jgi:hypothetical protein
MEVAMSQILFTSSDAEARVEVMRFDANHWPMFNSEYGHIRNFIAAFGIPIPTGDAFQFGGLTTVTFPKAGDNKKKRVLFQRAMQFAVANHSDYKRYYWESIVQGSPLGSNKASSNTKE